MPDKDGRANKSYCYPLHLVLVVFKPFIKMTFDGPTLQLGTVSLSSKELKRWKIRFLQIRQHPRIVMIKTTDNQDT